jgi:CheY-like chemotaxis protein
MDYEMPVMNGPAASKEIRVLRLCDSFIVGITGKVLPEDIDHFRRCGAIYIPQTFPD